MVGLVWPYGTNMNDNENSVSYKRLIYIAAISVAVITFLIFLPTLQAGFLDWDDNVFIFQTLEIRAIDTALFKRAFTTTVYANWYPLNVISYAVDYAIWGFDPFGYHLTNIVIHSINTFLVFVLAVRLLGAGKYQRIIGKEAIIAAAVVALLFGLHPINVESVAWISERKGLLSSFFILLSLRAYLWYVTTTSSRSIAYVATLVAFAMALMSKPMAVTLPILLLIIDFYPLERLSSKGKVILEKVPFFLLTIMLSMIAVWGQYTGGGMKSLEAYTLAERLLTATRAYVFYLYKMVWPTDLAPYYPYPAKMSFVSLEYMGAALLLILISAFCILMLKKNRLFAAVWLFYVVTLLPVIGIVQIGSYSAANRYAYLPLLSFYLLAGLGVVLFLRKFPSKKYLLMTTVVLFFLFTTLVGKTLNQTLVWNNTISLWTYEIELYPKGLGFPYYNRGLAYLHNEKFTEAISDFDMASRFNPTNEKIYNNRASAYANLGKLDKAIRDYEKTIELEPAHSMAHYNLAYLYSTIGEKDRSLIYYKKAASLGLKQAEDYLRDAGLE